MKLTFCGPFSRFAFARQAEDSFVVFDAESEFPRAPIAVFQSEESARQWIADQIKADPSMADDLA